MLLKTFSAPKGAPLSHRKHSFRNASSVVRYYLISHYVTVSDICITCAFIHDRGEANWRLKTRQTWLERRWAALAQECVSWPIRADWEFGKGGALKRWELKQMGNTVLLQSTLRENWCVLWALEHANLFQFFGKGVLRNIIMKYILFVLCKIHNNERHCKNVMESSEIDRICLMPYT